MNKVFKITMRRQIEHLRPLIFITFVFYLFLKGFKYFFGEDGFIACLIGGGIWYLGFNLIPQAVLHLRYYFLNTDYALICNQIEQQITVSTRDEESVFPFNDIKEVIYYKTRNKTKWSSLPWDKYTYMVIYLKNGNYFTITSLIAERLDLPEFVNTKHVELFFAFPRKGS